MLWNPQSQARTVLKYNAQYITYLRSVLACNNNNNNNNNNNINNNNSIIRIIMLRYRYIYIQRYHEHLTCIHYTILSHGLHSFQEDRG